MAEEREPQQGMTLEAPFEHLATKEDVANVRTEIEGVRTDIADLRGETRADNATLRGEMTTSIANLRSELKDEIAKVDRNVESIRAEMRTMKWMMGIVVAAVLVQLLERFFA